MQVGPDRGLANVVVWLRAGTGKYTEVPADVAAQVQPVEIDIPHCMYEPDVVVVFPTRFDPATRRQVPTGQELILKNSSPVGHSASWRGKYTHSPSLVPVDSNKQQIKTETGPPGAAGNEDLIQIACNVHPWMMAYAWAFDHPYATVSSGGRTGQTEFGNYTIAGAPAGVELELVYWHESMGRKPPVVLRKLTLAPGMNHVDIALRTPSDDR